MIEGCQNLVAEPARYRQYAVNAFIVRAEPVDLYRRHGVYLPPAQYAGQKHLTVARLKFP